MALLPIGNILIELVVPCALHIERRQRSIHSRLSARLRAMNKSYDGTLCTLHSTGAAEILQPHTLAAEAQSGFPFQAARGKRRQVACGRGLARAQGR
jgi:hypothetical protein